MVICENEPAELPKDVVRSTTKLDDDISQFNLNLVSIWEKFEKGASSNDADQSNGTNELKQPMSAGTVIEKPSINIKQTLLAFEKGSIKNDDSDDDWSVGDDHKQQVNIVERPKVRKLSNLNGFFDKQNNLEQNGKTPSSAPVKPLVIKRSESLMMRLRKYESRIAGEQVEDEDNVSDNSDNDELINNNNKNTINKNNKDEDSTSDITSQSEFGESESIAEKISMLNGLGKKRANGKVPKRLPSVDLSSLKNRWESGDINKRRVDIDEDENGDGTGDNTENGNSPLISKHEELSRLRQELVRKRSGDAGPVKNIYENAIKKAQLKEKEQALIRRDSNDLSTLNGLSTTEIQQRLLQNTSNGNHSNGISLTNGHSNSLENKQGINETPNTPTKDHFQLNFSRKANKLKERFELGLINNSSHDDSDFSEGDEAPTMTRLEQIRQEKLEELNVFKNGQSEAREARNLFKQIDKQISGAPIEQRQQQNSVKPRSFVKSKVPSMRLKLAANGTGSQSVQSGSSTPQTPTTPPAASSEINNHHKQQPQLVEQKVEQNLDKQLPVETEQNSTIKQRQYHTEQPIVSPTKQPDLKKEQAEPQRHPHRQAESPQKVAQVDNLSKEEALDAEKQNQIQPQIKQVEQQQQQQQLRPQQLEARLQLEQVSCPVGHQKNESQPSRKQRQQSLQQQQPKHQQQLEPQPRQPRQSDNQQSQKQRQQQQAQPVELERKSQHQTKQLEQLIQSQSQQQKILENQPIRLTNNCKNISKLKVLQSN